MDEVEYLQELKETSSELVEFFQEIDDKFSIIMEQSTESAAILSNWNQVFGLMKQATGQNGQTLYLDKIPIDQDNS